MLLTLLPISHLLCLCGFGLVEPLTTGCQRFKALRGEMPQPLRIVRHASGCETDLSLASSPGDMWLSPARDDPGGDKMRWAVTVVTFNFSKLIQFGVRKGVNGRNDEPAARQHQSFEA